MKFNSLEALAIFLAATIREAQSDEAKELDILVTEAFEIKTRPTICPASGFVPVNQRPENKKSKGEKKRDRAERRRRK